MKKILLILFLTTSYIYASDVKHLSNRDYNVLIALAILEETKCEKGRLDVVQSVMARVEAGHWGTTITNVAFASGQFQPFFGMKPHQVDSETEVYQLLMKKRSMSSAQAQKAVKKLKNDMKNTSKMKDARKHVGGRVYFKGESQYPNRVPSEDPLRAQGCNFFHIGPNETYKQLKLREQSGPLQIYKK
jgi:hypothetical protein